MYAPKLKTASKKSLLSQKSAVLQSSTKRDPLLQQVSRMGNAPNPKAHAAILNRAPVSQQGSNQQLLLLLQRQYGNNYVNRVLEIAQANKEETSVTSRKKPVIQAKLTIGQVGDKYEQEADRTAHQVIQKMSESETVPAEEERAQVEEKTDSPQIQQKCGCGQQDDSVQMKPETETLPSEEMSEKEDTEDLMVQRQPETETLPSEEMSEEEDTENLMVQRQPETETLPSEEMSEEKDNEDLMVQRKATGGRVEATPDLTSSIQRQKGKGQPLPGQLRQQLERAFGKDFSGVRIHADANADALTRSIKARAFTIGQDIFFRQGEYTPESKQGQELLAHELTHVVQQNGDGVKSKEDSGVKVSQVSEDTEVQPACAQCEQEEKAEGMIQAKEECGDANKTEESMDTCVSEEKQEAPQGGCSENGSENSQTDEPEPETETETDDCNQEKNTECNTNEEQDESGQEQQCPSEKEEEENGEQSEPNEVSQDRSKLDESATCEISRSINPPTINSQDAATTEQPTNSQAPTYNQNFTPDETTNPQAATTEQPANSQASTYNQNFTPDEITNPEVVTDSVQANTNPKETQGQLRTTDAQIAQLASAKINFKLPQQEETANNDYSALEAQRSTSSSMASNFFADAASRVQKVTGLGQNIAGRINQATEQAKAAVLSTVQKQKATVTAQINQKRTQVQNQAQKTLAEIQNQHQITVANIAQTTEATAQSIATEYSNTFNKLDEEKDKLLADIDQVYKDTYDDYITKGDEIGQEAIDIGEEYERQYLAAAEEEREEQKQLTQEYHEKVGELSQNQEARQNHRQTDTSGPPPKNKSNEIGEDLEKLENKIAANTDKVLKSDKKAAIAIEVAKSYQLQVKNQAAEQANQLANSKPEAVDGICCAITPIYNKLENSQKETINSLKDFQQSSIAEATNVQTALTESVNDNLQTTLESLDEQETIQLQILQGYGDRQTGVIEEDAEKAISALKNGIDQAATQLLDTLQGYYDEFQGMEAPHPDELRSILIEILGEIDNSIVTVEAETEKGITASAQGIQQGEQQVVGAVNEIAQYAIEEISIVAEEAVTGFVNLNQGIADAFKSLEDNYAEKVNCFVENTKWSLPQTIENFGQTFNCIYTNIETDLKDSVPQLEESLRSILDCLRTDIENYAKKAVGEDQEWWQKLLKALVFIAVIVIAILVAPLFAALGPIVAIILGVALGAALGALAQIANNAIDGKDLMKDVGDAAIMGAIGGALGGFGGALGGALGQAGKLGAGLAKSVAQYGIETAFDIAGEIVGNLATGEAITAEGILMGVAIGTAVHVSTTKIHGINKRAEAAETFNKNPDLINKLPKMSSDEINNLAKETGMNPGELQRLAKMKPDELKKYVEDAKERTSEYDSGAGQKIKNFAQGFENYQRSGAEFGQRVASKVARPIKNAFGGSRSEADVSTSGNRSDADTEAPRGLKSDNDASISANPAAGLSRSLGDTAHAGSSTKPDTKVSMTPRQQEVLENTAPKRGDELTPEEWKTELEVADKIEPKPVSEEGFVAQRELPNSHELKEKEDGSLCRASENCVNLPKNILENWKSESKLKITQPRSKALRAIDRAVEEYNISRTEKNLENALDKIKKWKNEKSKKISKRKEIVDSLEKLLKEHLEIVKLKKELDSLRKRLDNNDLEGLKYIREFEQELKTSTPQELRERFFRFEPDLEKYVKRNIKLENLENSPMKIALVKTRNEDNSLTDKAIEIINVKDRAEINSILERTQDFRLNIDGDITAQEIQEYIGQQKNKVTQETIFPELKNIKDDKDLHLKPSENIIEDINIGGVKMKLHYDKSDVDFETKLKMLKKAVGKVQSSMGIKVPEMQFNMSKFGRALKIEKLNNNIFVTESSKSERSRFIARDFIHVSSEIWNNPIDARDINMGKFTNLSAELEANGVATIVHELGHAIHFHNATNKFYQLSFTSFKEKSIIDRVRTEVSQYATNNPREFVAEVFLGLVYGKQYSNQIMDMYQSFGGLIPQKSGQMGSSPDTNSASKGQILSSNAGSSSNQTDTQNFPPSTSDI